MEDKKEEKVIEKTTVVISEHIRITEKDTKKILVSKRG